MAKSNKKKKCLSENLLGKTYSVLSENEDDLDVFGKFVTSELRGLQAEHLKKKKLNVKTKEFCWISQRKMTQICQF